MTDAIILMTTCPDAEFAENFAMRLVKMKLAACVNILPVMTSIYRWDNKVEKGSELQLLIKTTSNNFASIEKLIQTEHPYELAELLAIPVLSGSTNYLNWIRDNSCSTED